MRFLEVARLYQQRWQIEMFFKWIKQNLIVKKLWGHSENAVKIHLWVAIDSYLIKTPAQKQLVNLRNNADIESFDFCQN